MSRTPAEQWDSSISGTPRHFDEYGEIPFSDATIIGIPWVLFVLLALAMGLIVAGIYQAVKLCGSLLLGSSKRVAPEQVASSHATTEQPPVAAEPLPSYTLQSLPSAPLYPPACGEFRGSRSMPPTYVPTPFAALAAPNYCYYY